MVGAPVRYGHTGNKVRQIKACLHDSICFLLGPVYTRFQYFPIVVLFFLSSWSWGLCGTFYIKFIAESNLGAPTFQELVSLPVNCFGNKHKLQILDMAISEEEEV